METFQTPSNPLPTGVATRFQPASNLCAYQPPYTPKGLEPRLGAGKPQYSPTPGGYFALLFRQVASGEAECFQNHLGLKLICKIPALRHFRIPS
ncbi:hypothetical protein TL5118_01633 [Thalassovita autumnalis]|uniref:Uncharacterized protein n=1 Tax=Thalassovita autumnalis TaxID=2072972 RepID=A0A0N7LXP1_9RHOB|nr:hypothetical protein TL5118_01633 [Thalassovita autumnalis]CUH72447.1 hypothetical protein TL5120_02247 [Thalassovita autumnalis]